MFTRADAYVHRIWKTLRTASGWMLLLALAVSAIGWWRRSQRALAADAFGSGSADYEEFLFRQSPRGPSPARISQRLAGERRAGTTGEGLSSGRRKAEIRPQSRRRVKPVAAGLLARLRMILRHRRRSAELARQAAAEPIFPAAVMIAALGALLERNGKARRSERSGGDRKGRGKRRRDAK